MVAGDAPSLPPAVFCALALAAPARATDCERLEAGDTVFSACPGACFEVEADSAKPLGKVPSSKYPRFLGIASGD